ncbi:mechanosensitive ion channel family protein [Brucella pseudogrignonensis]|uniref:mechanosensitive ion channel family protein n=1 Tax=Brucella pseudogrignonensis TaxID=419475 RepID=UPI0028B415BC|nr:mechanosensitive ion channel family protein [Brucella pseudogrignonensis]MDT6941305.1 mechanosensitive ion channel family protein [Brucella pseudogrignonensis]
MSKYWIAAAIAVLFAITAFTAWFLMRHRRGWSRSISVHVVFVGMMFGAILTIRQIAFMLLEDYHITDITPDMIKTASVFAMALLTMQQLFQLINRLTHSQIARGNDVTSARMVARILKLAIFVVIMLIFGEHFGIGLSGLLAFGGIGGIAIGVAGKDMLSNLFSGVMLYFDRPFSIGDWISSPDRDIEGTVVEIGWRITKITTFENRPLYVPNAAFSTISVVNPGRMTNRRITTTVGLRYEDADKLAAVVEDIRNMLKNNQDIDQTQSLLVYFDAFADSSLNIMVYCFTKTTIWADWLAAQQEVYLKIIEIVHARGADFAFASETLYMQPSDDKKDTKEPDTLHSLPKQVRQDKAD